MSIFHKVFSGIFFRKPSAHILKPQSLNLYFKNSINPKFKILNISHYDCAEIEVVADKTQEDHIFRLNLNVFGTDKQGVINVANFETKSEAETAALILRSKIYSPGKTGFKIMTAIIALFFFFAFVASVIFGTLQSANRAMAPMSPEMLNQLMMMSSGGQMPSGAIPPQLLNNIGQQDMQKLQYIKRMGVGNDYDKGAMALAIKEANKVINQGGGDYLAAQKAAINGKRSGAKQASVPSVRLPKDQEVENFVNALR